MPNGAVMKSKPPSPLKKAIDEVKYLKSLSNKNLSRIERASDKALVLAEELEEAATIFLDAIDAYAAQCGDGSFVPGEALLALYTAMGRDAPTKEMANEEST